MISVDVFYKEKKVVQYYECALMAHSNEVWLHLDDLESVSPWIYPFYCSWTKSSFQKQDNLLCSLTLIFGDYTVHFFDHYWD